MSNEADVWQNFQKWLEYKSTQQLSAAQRGVIQYLEKSSVIVEKADATWSASANQPELPTPTASLSIVNDCLIEFTKLTPPPLGRKHYAASLKLLNIIKQYHLKRINEANTSELEKLARNAVAYESIQSSEYFRILRKSGLFENIEQEMRIISGTSGK